jgi:S-DNA-T family DNA segregation ATPase FtsK/SpoIIIE
MERRSAVADSTKSRGGNTSGSATDELIETMAVGMAKLIGMLAWWTVRFPLVSTPIAVALAATVLSGWRFGVVVIAVCAIGYGLWCHLDSESFHRLVWDRLRDSWMTWWRYKRSWDHVSTLHGLTARLGERTLIPLLRSVTIGATVDVLVVRIVTGQCVADWQKHSDALAEAWRAQRVTIRSVTPGDIRITVHHSDALVGPMRLPRPAIGTTVDPDGVGVGVTDAGRWWRLPVLGHHILVAGATGSGKGSVVWSLIAALAPAIRAGWVRLWVIDPKGGMEFGRGARLFTGFAYDNGEHTLGLLRAAVKVMQERAARLRGHTRLHTPTVAEPLIVLVVDELASLTAYIGDRKIRTEAEHLLGLLLSQGRAVGVSVVAAVQDPSKEVLPIRQLFTVRVALRMTESSQTTMVLGAGAREAGAVCDQISTTTPGVGYVLVDGTSEPLRVRAFHVTDADIDYLTEHFVPVRWCDRPDEGDGKRAL